MFQSDAYDFRKRGGEVRGKAEFKKEVTMKNVKLTGEGKLLQRIERSSTARARSSAAMRARSLGGANTSRLRS